MPGAYHSEFNSLSVPQVCGCSVLPLKTKVRGPAPQAPADKEDIIDEVLKYFKANVLFRTYEVKGPADRVLLYLTFYVHLCLLRIERKKITSKTEAEKMLFSLAQESATLAAPGESGFILGGYCSAPQNNQEKDTWLNYMKQAREELGNRLVPLVFDSNEGPNKMWIQFTRRKFLNKAFEN